MKKVREIKIEGDIAYVPLTKGYTAIIDAEDVPLVEGYNWHANVNGKTVYAKRNEEVKGKTTAILLHRQILKPTSDLVVDHIDRNGLNNRKNNLRLCTISQNACNRANTATNTSGYRGVRWLEKSKKWVASIRVNGKSIHLGCFDDIEDAHMAYCKASKKYHKEYGYSADKGLTKESF